MFYNTCTSAFVTSKRTHHIGAASFGCSNTLGAYNVSNKSCKIKSIKAATIEIRFNSFLFFLYSHRRGEKLKPFPTTACLPRFQK